MDIFTINHPERMYHKLKLIGIGLFFLLVVFDFSLIFQIIIVQFEIILAVNALVITLIALVITVIIALKQQDQLNSLQQITERTKEITERTGETAELLVTQSAIRKNVKCFFKTEGIGDEKYRLIFPVIYSSSKPLPLINQGDFYAINIVINRLGESKIVIEPVSLSKYSAPNGKYIIFICSPAANPVLNTFYGIKHIHGKIRSKVNLPRGLPCWFVNDDDNGTDDWKIRKILISEPWDLIPSNVTNLYEKAAKDGEKFVHPIETQQDYGIFGRWHEGGNQFIVIAGIHQYGTWIIGQLLNDLCCGEHIRGKNFFMGDQDFISVIEGEFEYPTLKVTRAEIFKNYIWIKINDKWVRQNLI